MTPVSNTKAVKVQVGCILFAYSGGNFSRELLKVRLSKYLGTITYFVSNLNYKTSTPTSSPTSTPASTSNPTPLQSQLKGE